MRDDGAQSASTMRAGGIGAPGLPPRWIGAAEADIVRASFEALGLDRPAVGQCGIDGIQADPALLHSGASVRRQGGYGS